MFGSTKQDEKAGQAMAEFARDVTSSAFRWKIFLWHGLILLCLWTIVLLIPNLIWAYILFALDSKILMLPVALFFGLSLYLAYAVGVHFIPDLEENKTLDNDVFESIGYQSSANKRIRGWMAAVLFAVFHVGAVLGTAFLLDGYGLYLFEF